MILNKLVSAIKNDVISGLRGHHTNLSISDEQLEDDIIDTRLQIIKEYQVKGILPIKDLLLSINCVEVDCKNIERCRCSDNLGGTPTAHFEIPQIINDFGSSAIEYIGTIDRQTPFNFYVSSQALNYYHKYRKRGKNKPYVYIDTTPNENGMYDCFIFNAPFIKQISISAVFKDPRQLEKYSCCSDLEDDNFSFINNEIKNRLTKQKIQYYRQLAAPLKPNDQTYT